MDLSDTSKNVIRELNNLRIGLAHTKFGFRQKQELMEKKCEIMVPSLTDFHFPSYTISKKASMEPKKK